MDLPRTDLGEGAWLAYLPGFVADPEAVMAALLAELPLRVERLRIGSREVETPRLTAWHGDPGRAYRYSGRTFEPDPWTPTLAALRERVGAACGAAFDSVLANLYRDGRDAMGWHADDEPELGHEPVIASLSLGDVRRFVLKHRRADERLALDLPSGSLLVMQGATQANYRHALPRTARGRAADQPDVPRCATSIVRRSPCEPRECPRAADPGVFGRFVGVTTTRADSATTGRAGAAHLVECAE